MELAEREPARPPGCDFGVLWLEIRLITGLVSLGAPPQTSSPTLCGPFSSRAAISRSVGCSRCRAVYLRHGVTGREVVLRCCRSRGRGMGHRVLEAERSAWRRPRLQSAQLFAESLPRAFLGEAIGRRAARPGRDEVASPGHPFQHARSPSDSLCLVRRHGRDGCSKSVPRCPPVTIQARSPHMGQRAGGRLATAPYPHASQRNSRRSVVGTCPSAQCASLAASSWPRRRRGRPSPSRRWS